MKLLLESLQQGRGPNWPFDVEKLQIGDKCQFRFNAYPEWYDGGVVENGMHLTWTVRMR